LDDGSVAQTKTPQELHRKTYATPPPLLPDSRASSPKAAPLPLWCCGGGSYHERQTPASEKRGFDRKLRPDNFPTVRSGELAQQIPPNKFLPAPPLIFVVRPVCASTP